MSSTACLLVPLVGALLGAPTSIAKDWSARERAAARFIAKNVISAHVRFLADDLLEGRAPGSRGSELAMRYIAGQYERIGLEPAGDRSTYFQRFDVVGLRTEVASGPTFTAEGKEPFAPRNLAEAVTFTGIQRDAASIAGAEVVFVGYGITAPEQKWDDFKDADLRGKVLLVMNNDPADDPALFAGKTRLYYGRWTYKYEEAARRGAAGAIVIHTTPSAGYPWQVVQTSWSGEQFELPARPGTPTLPVKMWLTEDAARRVAALGGFDLDELRRRAERRDFRPVALGVRMSVALKVAVRRLQTANVLGRLPGSDPKLAREVVVYTAHHDHLGVGEAKDGDAIYNGALDNASGVGAMLSIAESMARAKPRPRRSVLFAAVAAEESGLLGSEYFCANPVVHPGRIAANINIDSVNVLGPTRDVTFIGMGKSTLDAVLEKAAREQGRVVRPDQFPDRGSFYRSDQFNFARVGVPAIYLSTGTDFVGKPPEWGRQQIEEYVEKRYHQPSDQIDDSWNLDGAVDDARLLLVVGMRVADDPELPGWKPGDEFEAARKRALTEAASSR